MGKIQELLQVTRSRREMAAIVLTYFVCCPDVALKNLKYRGQEGLSKTQVRWMEASIKYCEDGNLTDPASG